MRPLASAVMVLASLIPSGAPIGNVMPLGCSVEESARYEAERERYQGTDPDRDFQSARPFLVLRMPCDLPQDVRVLILSEGQVKAGESGQLIGVYPINTAGNVTLREVSNAIDDLGWLSEPEPGIFHLDAALVQTAGTSLVISAPDVLQLRIESRPGAFLGGRNAQLTVDGVSVTSWNSASDSPDHQIQDGRPFILFERGGRLDVSNSTLSYLGADFGKSYGIAWREGAEGSLIDSEVHHNFFGVYTYETSNIVIRGNQVYDNIRYGIDPHSYSVGMLIEDNEVYRNGSHGIIASQDVANSVIRYNYSHDNAGNGIMLHARSGLNEVSGNVVADNEGHGIVTLGSAENVIRENEVSGHSVGIRVSGGESLFNQVAGNEVTDNQVGISVYNSASHTKLLDNLITGSEGAAVIIRDSQDTVVTGGSIHGSTIGVRTASDAEISGLVVSGTATGIKVLAPAEVDIDAVTISASRKGIDVQDGSAVTVSNSSVSAPRPLFGEAISESTGLEVIEDETEPATTGGSRALPWIGIGLIVMAAALEVFRSIWSRNRGRHRGETSELGFGGVGRD